MSKLRVGVIGVGYLGRFHAQKYAAHADTELVAVADISADIASRVATELGVQAVTDFRTLLPLVEAVSIASTTASHHSIARECLAAGKHVLIEKPITVTVAEAEELVAIARANTCVFQVGHIERFNPVWVAARPRMHAPLFIESHRMAPFKPRGTDVSVVLDLMIHDIDLVFAVTGSAVVELRANGVSVLTDGVDIASARIELANGCVANLTSSRVSPQTMRKMRLFQADEYLSLDFHSRRVVIGRARANAEPSQDAIEIELIDVPAGDALADEVAAFIAAVKNASPPAVSGEDGKRALEVALEVVRQIGDRRPANL